MAEEERLIEFRVARVEVDVKDLKTEMTAMRECQIKTNSSLDNLLIGFGELKQGINNINNKPSKLIDTLKTNAATAVMVTLIYAAMFLILK
jgi:hypothetical protein